MADPEATHIQTFHGEVTGRHWRPEAILAHSNSLLCWSCSLATSTEDQESSPTLVLAQTDYGERMTLASPCCWSQPWSNLPEITTESAPLATMWIFLPGTIVFSSLAHLEFGLMGWPLLITSLLLLCEVASLALSLPLPLPLRVPHRLFHTRAKVSSQEEEIPWILGPMQLPHGVIFHSVTQVELIFLFSPNHYLFGSSKFWRL